MNVSKTSIAVGLALLNMAAVLAQPAIAFQELLPDAIPQFNTSESFTVRIKDITAIEGERTQKLTGMGLVVGLNKTGGSNPQTREFALRMLERFGSRVSPELRAQIITNTQFKTPNLSIVTVTAELPAHIREGALFDVTVSAFDNATSLQNGELIITPLVGIDKQVYALASGKVSVGGAFSAAGQAASVAKNHLTSGHIVRGGQVEEVVCEKKLGEKGVVNFLLHQSDFNTADRIQDEINQFFPSTARIVDAGTIEVRIPEDQKRDVFSFVSRINNLRVVPDVKARVVISEATGTVVVGENVRLSRVGITHANLSVITGESPQISQPAPFSKGQTTVVPRTTIDVNEGDNPLQIIEQSATVGELAKALNALGATPRDLSAIFQQLNRAGALHAELIFD